MELQYEKDSKERMPWEHYTQEFAAADPKEIASRLSIPYDEKTKKLTLTFHIRRMISAFIRWRI